MAARVPHTQPPYIEPPHWRPIVLTFLLLIAVLAPVAPLVRNLQQRTRGIVYGIPPRMPHTDVRPYAVNADLTPLDDVTLVRALNLLTRAGFGWVRLRFPWFAVETRPGVYEWGPWDRVVEAAQARGLDVIALIDGTPPWYRPPGEEDNPVVPPTDLDAFARFAGELARRYGPEIDYYQVWDQPNVSPFWGNEQVDPAGYVDMLRRVGTAIRQNDPHAYILSAGLAPTALHEPYNLSDLDYLEAMYAAGGGGTFDILGVKAYDLEGGDPWSRDYDPDRLGVARLVLLREVMVRHGDEGTPMWLVGWGRHATPPNWQGRPSIWGTVSEAEQARYVREVFQRKREEWPWLGLLTWDQFYPQVPEDDPLWGFALVRPDWRPRPVYYAFRDLAAGAPRVGTGRYGPRAWVWRSPDAQLRHTLQVEGTLVGIIAGQLVAVEASLDGEERSILLDANRQYLLGNRLELAPHEVVLRFDPPGVTTLLVGVNRPIGPYLVLTLLALVAVGTLLRLGLWITWSPTRDVVLPGLLLVLTPFYMVAPTLELSLVTLGILAALVLYRLEWGLVAVMASLPFVAAPKHLGPWQFSLVETYIGLCALSWGLRLLVEVITITVPAVPVPMRVRVGQIVGWWVDHLRPRGALDILILLLVLVGTWAATGARYQDVAWRQVRWLVVEPALFYWMVRSRWRRWVDERLSKVIETPGSWVRKREVLLHQTTRTPPLAVRLVNGLLWGALLAVGLGVILLLVHPQGAFAEGVWRLRGVYGSPNNMALLLGRAVAISLALVWFLPSSPYLDPASGRRGQRSGPARQPAFPTRPTPSHRSHAVADENGATWRHPLPPSATLLRTEEETWPALLPRLSVRQGYRLATAVLVLGLLLTVSRGALILGLPVTLLLLGALANARRRRHALIGVALLFLLQVPLLGTERFRSLFTAGGTPRLRLELWRSSLLMLRDHLWRGVGPDNFLYYFSGPYLPRADYPEPTLSHPHNVVLHFWLALGIPGLLWLAITLWTAVRKTLRLLHFQPPTSSTRALLVGTLAIHVYGLAHGLVDQSFLLPDLMILFLFGLAVVQSMEEGMRLD